MPEVDKIKVVIPRPKWTGRDGYTESSGCSPHITNGSQCCMGHVMNAVLGDKWWPTENGLPKFISMPHSNNGKYLPKLPAWMGDNYEKSFRQPNETGWLAYVNDSIAYPGGQAMKEANIAYILGEYGFDVEFID